MDIFILDPDRNPVSIFDNYTSFIWSERYIGAGDFEIFTRRDTSLLDFLKKDNLIQYSKSNKLMIIESINAESDIENGDTLKITGKSLESILNRRIILEPIVFSGKLQNGIETLLNTNVIDPKNKKRKIDNFVFKKSTDDYVSKIEIEYNWFGENLYDAIYDLCSAYDIGFRVLPIDDGGFEFSLYRGEDRSYDQEERPWVVFSPLYNNLKSTNYTSSYENYKTVAIAIGDSEDPARFVEVGEKDKDSGLNRREVFVEDSEIHEIEEEEVNEKYEEQLKTSASLALLENKAVEAYDGEIEPNVQFIYGKDFFLGDIAEIEDEYGMKQKVRISEITFSHDETGETVVPTFVTYEEEKY